MKPHPLEFRQRIVAAVDQQEHTIEEVAALFGVSERYVYQLLKRPPYAKVTLADIRG